MLKERSKPHIGQHCKPDIGIGHSQRVYYRNSHGYVSNGRETYKKYVFVFWAIIWIHSVRIEQG